MSKHHNVGKSKRRHRAVMAHTRTIIREIRYTRPEEPANTRDAFGLWVTRLREHKHRVLYRKRHHYAVAAGLSALLILFGHMPALHYIEHALGWAYAVYDNLFSID